MNLAFLALLPAALLIDRLFGELPSRVHPVCMMGALASRIEALFRRGSNNALMSLSGTLACLLVVLPCAALAGGLAWAAQVYADPRAAWFVSAIIIWICVAPRSLEEHALRVAVPLAKGDLEGARKAVSMMVSLPFIAFASRIIPNLRHSDILPVGWKYRAAHESPNSAWSEAAFAGALGLKLGGPAVYGDLRVDHPWLGGGTPDAKPAHIVLAVRLMWHSVIVFTLFEVFLIGMLSL